MPKNKTKNKQRKKIKQKQPTQPSSKLANTRNPTFGPVATINTAPVAIGNSMRGAKAQVFRTSNDACRVVGRDFAYTAYNTGSATGWTLVGGVPLTPACFQSSVLRNYCQMYNKFKFSRVRFHYITSSPTSSSGDILFQVQANRTDPGPNWTASTFLPYALSKPETIIGPQWTNHTVEIMPKGPTRMLDPGMNIDIDYQAQGEVLMFSKTSSTDSPGYVLIDYDVTFSEMSVNPRQGLLPNPNFVWFPIQLVWPTTALTANSTNLSLIAGSRGSGNTAITAITSTTSWKSGDVYKVYVDATNTVSSAWTVSSGSVTIATLFDVNVQSTNAAVSIVDGYTFYILTMSSTQIVAYATLTEATTSSQRFISGATVTANTYGESAGVPNAGVWLFGFASYVCTIAPNSLQQQ